MRLSPVQFTKSLLKILRGKPRIPATLQDNLLLETVLKRRSARKFTAGAIPPDAWAAILEAARVAPSTVNLQTWSFAAFDAAGWSAMFGRPIPFKAQRAVIVMGDVHRVRQVMDPFPHSPVLEYTVAVMNASLAAMNMTIAAEALGISSVMLSETGRTGLLDAGYLKETLCLPEGVFPLMTIVFGYPAAARPPMPPRLPLEQVVFNGRYPQPDQAALEDWLAQMVAGYKAGHLDSSFEQQLGVYHRKIGQAEVDLQRMVLGEERE